MNSWQATFFGFKQIPRELTAFEIEAFFTFTATERQVIEQRRRPTLKLGLALQIGFLRMSGRVLDAVRVLPAVLWRYLGEQFNVAAPDLASLRAMYGRGNTAASGRRHRGSATTRGHRHHLTGRCYPRTHRPRDGGVSRNRL
jgi:hypothetical protein